MWVKNITDFGRFFYLNIPCLKINITLIIFTSSSSEEFTSIKQMHVSVSFRRPHMVFPYKALQIWLKRFSEYLAFQILYRPDSWQAFLYIYLLSFPRLQTFCIKWFAILFFMA